jgi:transcriptional regulator with XRE-family HTH domain
MEEKSTDNLIAHLRGERLRQELSQVQLGHLVGAPQSQITRIESGASDIRLSTLLELAHALGLEPVLVPKVLLPAVRHVMAHRQENIDSPKPPAEPRRLLGNEPEDELG